MVNMYKYIVFTFDSILMVDKMESHHNHSNNYRELKNILAWVIFTIVWIMWVQDVLAQTPPAKDNLHKPDIALAKKEKIFEYVNQNITDCYPDMKIYFDTLFNKFESQTRLDTAIFFLNKMYSAMDGHIQDPKQKVGAIICGLEGCLLKWEFYKKHGNEISDETLSYVDDCDAQYSRFLKRYFSRIDLRKTELLNRMKQLDDKDKQLDIELKKLNERNNQLNEELKKLNEENNQLDAKSQKDRIEIEKIMSWIPASDVAKSSSTKQLVIDTYNLAKRDNHVPSYHMLELYNATQK